MADQDDLLLLHHLRAHACGCERRLNASRDALAQDPGRAAGRVASWALGRTTELISRYGRRAWNCGEGLVPTAQEMRLAEMVRALADYDRERAERVALWLVPKREVASLLDRAAPLTHFYGYGRTGEIRRAAHA